MAERGNVACAPKRLARDDIRSRPAPRSDRLNHVFPGEQGTMPHDPTRSLIDRHLAAWRDMDIEGVMSDWTDDGLIVSTSGIYTGSAKISEFYRAAFARREAAERPEILALKTLDVQNGVAMCEWRGGLPEYARGLVIVRDGRKTAHTFGAKPYFEAWNDAGAAGSVAIVVG
jgi:hypothetical protein